MERISEIIRERESVPKLSAQSFAGLKITESGPVVRPCLPEGWTRVAFRFCAGEKWYRAEPTRDKGVVEAL